MDLVLLFPGQGSQKPGMGKDLADAHPAARAVFDAVDRALGAPLARLCFEGPADELTLTHNAQPALLAHGLAVWATVRDRLRASVKAAAGHSLGEFTAYGASGALDVERAARLVRRRGELMYEAGVKRPGAMAAVLGTLQQPIDELCARAAKESGVVVPANYNSPEQVVVSGEVKGVDRAMELAKEAGAKRVVKLNVSGAFHSPLMEFARPGLEAALKAAAFERPGFPVYSNVTASPVSEAAEASSLLLDQLTSPVRWTDLVARLAKDHPGALFVEMGPGNVLVGLVKRIAPGVATATCGTAAEVDQLLTRAAA
ncbi:MAG TPA: ACP S-malonyltransferase [Gemmatimonadaceae bacterium]|nr:ACP S-malonyltransferase [Gemmatimonadaceae bacterium]